MTELGIRTWLRTKVLGVRVPSPVPMSIDNLIEEVCKIENPFEFREGMWHEPLEGYLLTHEMVEENAAYISFEECRNRVLLLLTAV